MPEYLAISHFHNATNSDGAEPEAPAADEVSAMFLRMERAGIAKVH